MTADGSQATHGGSRELDTAAGSLRESYDELAPLWERLAPLDEVLKAVLSRPGLDDTQRLQLLLEDQRQRWQRQQPQMVEAYWALCRDWPAGPTWRQALEESETALRGGLETLQVAQPTVVGQAGDEPASVETGVLPRTGADPGSLETGPGQTEDIGPRDRRRDRRASPGEPGQAGAGPAGQAHYVGRYRLVKLLGEGGFGRVWQARDDELRRDVAIKIPKPERFQSAEDVEQYLAEARTLAALRHPHIVPVYDLGRDASGLIFVVSLLIPGETLRAEIRRGAVTHERAVEIIRAMAAALDHAHAQQLIHRDVKPENILVEHDTRHPWLTDFGLAVREEETLTAAGAGTPAYMSPEQTRGCGHRLDGRSDLFALGVILYEMLAGRRPFRSKALRELVSEIRQVNPPPLDEVAPNVPPELARICAKLLSKRPSERHASARELCVELDDWRDAGATPAATGPEQVMTPRGLRPFTEDDRDFFLDLLPGPRERGGLPRSVAFWKERLEETNPAATFRVGLLYGPSGCGKSSLVRAGLIPHLGRHVRSVFIEASATETESRLLKALRQELPELPPEAGLAATLQFIRRRGREPGARKLVLFIDQFEQWLLAHPVVADAELLAALWECDGSTLQAVILVRDDFAMGASRFMAALDLPIVQEQNFRTVDLFDIDHARTVLIRFGRAFGRLPAPPGELSEDNEQFVRLVAEGLASEGQVISVRLALFAEMVKHRQWVPATLVEVGGTRGLGRNFLEETFTGKSANPRYRALQEPCRGVLRALLPAVGVDIKGRMKSVAELAAAVGTQTDPARLEEVLRILDSDLKLISPGEGGETGPAAGAHRYYQLAHDYLVHSLRDWLTLKQRETPRGRAELLLAERAELWNDRPENRNLPTLLEHLAIRRLTDTSRRTPPERRMLAQAARLHGTWGAGLVATLLLAGLVFSQTWRAIERVRAVDTARGLVQQLSVSRPQQVPGLLARLGQLELRPHVTRELLRRLEVQTAGGELHAAGGTPLSGSRSEGVVTRLALYEATGDATQVAPLVEALGTLPVDLFPLVRAAVETDLGPDQLETLWTRALDTQRGPEERFRCGCALAGLTAGDARWARLGPFLMQQLLRLPVGDLVAWREQLRPAAPDLGPAVLAAFLSNPPGSVPRQFAAETLVEFAGDNPALLTQAWLQSDATTAAVLLPALRVRDDESLRRLQAALTESAAPAESTDPAEPRLAPGPVDEVVRDTQAARQARARLGLALLGEPDSLWRALAGHDFAPGDRRLQTALIHELPAFAVPHEQLLDRLEREPDPLLAGALLRALGGYRDRLTAAERQRVLDHPAVTTWRVATAAAGTRSALLWLHTHWQVDLPQAQAETPGVPPPVGPAPGWYVARHGDSYTLLGPVEFEMGTPPGERGRGDEEARHRVRIPRRFALQQTEVSGARFAQFLEATGATVPAAGESDPRAPRVQVSWFDAARFCNWLSAREGLPPEQWCYEERDGLWVPAEGALQRTGYRLPTEAEWEVACRAGTNTPRPHGGTEWHLTQFAWYHANSEDAVHPVGQLQPNDWGLFDLLGNASEWCHEAFVRDSTRGLPAGEVRIDDHAGERFDASVPRVLRGGAFSGLPNFVRSGFRGSIQPSQRRNFIGFRTARTIEPKPGSNP